MMSDAESDRMSTLPLPSFTVTRFGMMAFRYGMFRLDVPDHAVPVGKAAR